MTTSAVTSTNVPCRPRHLSSSAALVVGAELPLCRSVKPAQSWWPAQKASAAARVLLRRPKSEPAVMAPCSVMNGERAAASSDFIAHTGGEEGGASSDGSSLQRQTTLSRLQHSAFDRSLLYTGFDSSLPSSLRLAVIHAVALVTAASAAACELEPGCSGSACATSTRRSNRSGVSSHEVWFRTPSAGSVAPLLAQLELYGVLASPVVGLRQQEPI